MIKVQIVNKDVDALMEVITELGRIRSFRDPLAGAGVELTPPQVHAVLWLGLEGPLSHSTLAQRAGCSAPSTTGLVDRLQREGLVERVRDEDDRRVVLVQLTGKGEQIAAHLRGFFRERMQTVLGALSPEDRHALIGIARRLRDVMVQQHATSQTEDAAEDAP
jgi:DNA-binding MarR family transcriptional regulator